MRLTHRGFLIKAKFHQEDLKPYLPAPGSGILTAVISVVSESPGQVAKGPDSGGNLASSE